MAAEAKRCVADLLRAEPCPRPRCIPIGRPRGVKALGIRYERTVAKALKGAFPSSRWHIGQWFDYIDANGRGYCQADVLLHIENVDAWVVLECKLTDTTSARQSLRTLYMPVVGAAYGRHVAGIVVTRHLTRDSDPTLVYGDFRTALRVALGGSQIPTWHYIGKGAP